MRLRIARACCWISLAAALPATAESEVTTFHLGGSVETLPFLSYAGPDDLSGAFSYGSETMLDLDLSARGPDGPVQTSVGASLESDLFTGYAATVEATAWLQGLEPDEGFAAPPPTLAELPSTLLEARVRAAWAKLDWGWASLQAGRQVLSYGRGAWWSPVDIYTRTALSGISSQKAGTDALRIRLPFGDTGMVDLAGAPSSQPADGTYSMRVSGLPSSGFDIGAVAGYSGGGPTGTSGPGLTAGLGDCALGCLDFKLDLGASFYGEVLGLLPAAGGQGLLRAAGGLDWSTDDFYFAVEYYFNGGVVSSEDPYLAGEHNAFGQVSWKITPFVTLMTEAIWDISDSTGTGLACLSIDAAQNASLSTFAELSQTSTANAGLVIEAGVDLMVKF